MTTTSQSKPKRGSTSTPAPEMPAAPPTITATAAATATKAALRAEARRRRSALAGDTAAQSQRAAGVARQLAALPQLRRARVVASYAPTQGELDPNGFRALLVPPLMAPQLLFPRVCGSHNLSLHACEPAELRPGAFGILEPVATVPRVEVQKAEVILLPGLAFDRCGARLGYGKGYYDSLLAGFGESTETGAAEVAGTTLVAAPAKPEVAGVDVLPRLPRLSEAGEARPLLVGISYDETLFEHIPSEPHDVRVDAVVTPTQTLWATHG